MSNLALKVKTQTLLIILVLLNQTIKNDTYYTLTLQIKVASTVFITDLSYLKEISKKIGVTPRVLTN